MKPSWILEARWEAICGEVQRMLKLGVIQESQSNWSSPVVLLPKPDGSWRLCNNFWQLKSYKFCHLSHATYRWIVRPTGSSPVYENAWSDQGVLAKEKTAFVTLDGADSTSHLPKVQAMLNSIWEAEFTANPKKRTIVQVEARYLGYTIGRRVIKPQINKVEAIHSWSCPNSKKQVLLPKS